MPNSSPVIPLEARRVLNADGLLGELGTLTELDIDRSYEEKLDASIVAPS